MERCTLGMKKVLWSEWPGPTQEGDGSSKSQRMRRNPWGRKGEKHIQADEIQEKHIQAWTRPESGRKETLCRADQPWQYWHWGLENSLLWRLSCACRMLSSSLGLYPLDATSIPDSYDGPKYLQIPPNAPKQQMHPMENPDSWESLPVCVKRKEGEKGEFASDWKKGEGGSLGLDHETSQPIRPLQFYITIWPLWSSFPLKGPPPNSRLCVQSTLEDIILILWFPAWTLNAYYLTMEEAEFWDGPQDSCPGEYTYLLSIFQTLT